MELTEPKCRPKYGFTIKIKESMKSEDSARKSLNIQMPDEISNSNAKIISQKNLYSDFLINLEKTEAKQRSRGVSISSDAGSVRYLHQKTTRNHLIRMLPLNFIKIERSTPRDKV